jgi:hypothetical protein
MIDPPNPFDPWDTQRRWLRNLYPVERGLVYAAAAGVIALLAVWVFR